jgi:hypothetical protein
MNIIKSNFYFLIFCALVVFFACNSNNNKTTESASFAIAEMDSPAPADEITLMSPPAQGQFEPQSKDLSMNEALNKNNEDKHKIINDGSISIKTKDINTSKKEFDAFLKKINGYYESEDLKNDESLISYNLKIRVPADKFEILINAIEKGENEIIRKSIQARDVTEEYVDITSRLNNKKEYLNRYKVLLVKASTVKDILEIEENIRVIQEEIESTEGRLKYLNDQIAFSTLNIHLFREKEYVYQPTPQDKFSERVKDALSNGWKAVVDFVLQSISAWPFLILMFVAIIIIKRIIKKRRANKL